MAGNPLRNQETDARGLTATVSMSSITHCNLLFYCLSSLPLLESGQPSNRPGVRGGKAQVQLTCVQEDVQGFGFSPQRCCVYCSEINTILGVLNYFYFSLYFCFSPPNTLSALTSAIFIGTLEISQPAWERCALLPKKMNGVYCWLTRNHVYSQKNVQNLYKLFQACSVF